MKSILSIDVGTKNLGICLFYVSDPSVQLQMWRVCSIFQGNTKDIHTIAQALYELLDSIPEPNIVLIENQPALKNPIMKTIQVLIFSYYFQKIYNKSHTVEHVHYVSASVKLKPFDILTNNYKQRKSASIEIASSFLPTMAPLFRSEFESSPKKDDLADSLLQGISWCIQHNLLTKGNFTIF